MWRQILPITALFASAALLLVGSGLQAVLMPVRGQEEGFSSLSIAMLGVAWAIGFTIGCFYVPKLVKRVGHIRTFSSLCAVLAAVMLLTGLVVEEVSWILLRAATGFCVSGAWMIIESWMNERVDNQMRGTIFSVYMVISLLASMGGQYMVALADPMTHVLFMVGALFYAFSVLPTALSRAQSPAPLTQVRFDLKKLYANSSSSVFGAMLAGVIAGAWGSFAAVYAKQVGMSNANVANLLAAAMLGSILFQMPIGRLSDMMDRRYIMVGTSVLGALAGYVITTFPDNNPNPSLLFFGCNVVFGGFIYAIYSLSVAYANDHSAPEDFVETSSGLLILYGIGTMVGPLFTSWTMEMMGPGGLFFSIGTMHVVLALLVMTRIFQKSLPASFENTDFQTVPLAKTQTPETYALDPRAEVEPDMAES